MTKPRENSDNSVNHMSMYCLGKIMSMHRLMHRCKAIYPDSCDNITTHQMTQEQEVEGHTRHTETPVGEVGTAHNCVITTDILPVRFSTGISDVLDIYSV